MDVIKPQLQALLVQARAWEDRLKRTILADSVVFTVDSDTKEFTMTANWLDKTGAVKSHSRFFSRDLLFGPISSRGPRPMMQRKLCDLMKEFMREVLALRGIR